MNLFSYGRMLYRCYVMWTFIHIYIWYRGTDGVLPYTAAMGKHVKLTVWLLKLMWWLCDIDNLPYQFHTPCSWIHAGDVEDFSLRHNLKTMLKKLNALPITCLIVQYPSVQLVPTTAVHNMCLETVTYTVKDMYSIASCL